MAPVIFDALTAKTLAAARFIGASALRRVLFHLALSHTVSW
jgi:hypothetical protein